MSKGTYSKLVFLGTLLICAGILLLLWTHELISLVGSIAPMVIVIAGAFLLYQVFTGRQSVYYLFPGFFLFFIAIFIILKQHWLSEKELGTYWPLFMLALGITLMVFGIRQTRSNRISFVVPGVAIIALSLVFLSFSMNIIKLSFREFIVLWWPVFFILLGAILIIVYLYYHVKKKIRR